MYGAYKIALLYPITTVHYFGYVNSTIVLWHTMGAEFADTGFSTVVFNVFFFAVLLFLRWYRMCLS